MRTHPRRIMRRSAQSWMVFVALGAAVAGGASGVSGREPQGRGQHPAPRAGGPDSFGRMFELPPFAAPTPQVHAALMELGKRGGLMDAGDDLNADPLALITDPALSVNNPDSDQHVAGVTFLGQFLDHDMTFDASSPLGRPTDPRRVPNVRRPFFDLDSVYGSGPAGSPLLYEPLDPAKLRVEFGGRFEDLPRTASGTALIADPRNDENLVIAGLHAAFLLFHNGIVNLVRDEHPEWSSDQVFSEARRLTTWHYQWIIVHEVLPAFVGHTIAEDVLRGGRRFYVPPPGGAHIPIEFQIAYRFGHSMVRPSYRANFTGNGGQPFVAMLFRDQPPGTTDPSDLRGGVRSERRYIGWQTFFPFPGFEADVRANKRVDTRVSSPLFDLPLGAIPGGAPPTALAQRNLLRHLTWRVPSGQAIAAAMGVPALGDGDLSELYAIDSDFVRSTPLWYYVLKEADVLGFGRHLGPVGGRIVAEVFVGLLELDPESYLNRQPDFIPSIGSAGPRFSIVDFLTFAGVAEKR